MFSEEEIVETIARRPNPIEALLKQIMVICGDYEKNIKLRRLLRKYRERKDRLETRRLEWYEMMKKKPNPDKPDPEDVASIELAKDTVGDYQLKTAPGELILKDNPSFYLKYSLVCKSSQRIIQTEPFRLQGAEERESDDRTRIRPTPANKREDIQHKKELQHRSAKSTRKKTRNDTAT